jgi:hypothetical protein
MTAKRRGVKRGTLLVGRRCVHWKGLVFSYRPKYDQKHFAGTKGQGTKGAQ